MEINDNESEVHQEEPKESKAQNMKKISSIDGKKKGKGTLAALPISRSFMRKVVLIFADLKAGG